jgi:hypothetical protein
MNLRLQFAEIRGEKPDFGPDRIAIILCALLEYNDALGVALRERPKQDAAKKTEDGGVGPDAEREREDDDRGETRIVPEGTKSLAEAVHGRGISILDFERGGRRARARGAGSFLSRRLCVSSLHAKSDHRVDIGGSPVAVPAGEKTNGGQLVRDGGDETGGLGKRPEGETEVGKHGARRICAACGNAEKDRESCRSHAAPAADRFNLSRIAD